jgi:hypothetical protein
MKLTPQYIAGFIDGEGYLGIIRKTDKVRSTLGHYYKVCIKIAQTNDSNEILYLLKERYGGNISKTRVHKGKNQSPSDMIEFTNSVRIRRILDDIQPYLIVKSKQAEVLRSYIDLPKQTKTNRTQSDAMREELYKQIKVLNRRGLAETE